MTVFRSKCCKATIAITADANENDCQVCTKCHRVCEAETVSAKVTPKRYQQKKEIEPLPDDPLANLDAGLPPKTAERVTERMQPNKANRRIEHLESFIRLACGDCADCGETITDVDEIVDNYDDAKSNVQCAACAAEEQGNETTKIT